jgi:hypothetical protein
MRNVNTEGGQSSYPMFELPRKGDANTKRSKGSQAYVVEQSLSRDLMFLHQIKMLP